MPQLEADAVKHAHAAREHGTQVPQLKRDLAMNRYRQSPWPNHHRRRKDGCHASRLREHANASAIFDQSRQDSDALNPFKVGQRSKPLRVLKPMPQLKATMMTV